MNLNVDKVSSKLDKAGDIVPIIAIFELPSKESYYFHKITYPLIYFTDKFSPKKK